MIYFHSVSADTGIFFDICIFHRKDNAVKVKVIDKASSCNNTGSLYNIISINIYRNTGKKYYIKEQFKTSANIIDTWLYTAGSRYVSNSPDLDKKLQSIIGDMVYYTQESGSRFNTGIKGAAIYDSNGQLLTSTLSKMIEWRVKGENDILVSFKKLNHKIQNLNYIKY